MSEAIALLGSLGSLSAAVYLWKFSRVAALFRYAAVAVAVVVGLSIAGIISLDVHPDRALELGSTIASYAPLVTEVII